MTAVDPTRTLFLSSKIATLGTAKAWIAELVRRGLDFHFEDDPSEIMSMRTHDLTFSEPEWPLIRDRVRELYAIDWKPEGVDCPIEYVLKITGHEMED